MTVSLGSSDQNAALVLFSGGQDSTACLAWALDRYERVETIGFTYGQRHIVEMECRAVILSKLAQCSEKWAARLGDDAVLDLGVLGTMSQTALTKDIAIEMGASGLPTTFVPGRNLIFLNFAAAFAYRRGIDVLVAGMCETDYSGYPDCRRDTIDATERSLSLGMAKSLTIETPLMWLDKAETWALGNEIGGRSFVEITLENTHTCYNGNRTDRHDWGYGCNACPACELRSKGWAEWQESLVQ